MGVGGNNTEVLVALPGGSGTSMAGDVEDLAVDVDSDADEVLGVEVGGGGGWWFGLVGVVREQGW